MGSESLPEWALLALEKRARLLESALTDENTKRSDFLAFLVQYSSSFFVEEIPLCMDAKVLNKQCRQWKLFEVLSCVSKIRSQISRTRNWARRSGPGRVTAGDGQGGQFRGRSQYNLAVTNVNKIFDSTQSLLARL